MPTQATYDLWAGQVGLTEAFIDLRAERRGVTDVSMVTSIGIECGANGPVGFPPVPSVQRTWDMAVQLPANQHQQAVTEAHDVMKHVVAWVEDLSDTCDNSPSALWSVWLE